MAEGIAEVLGEVWDDGNCTGLDGWIGPGRGSAEIDSDALHARERVIEKALTVLAANGYGKLEDAFDEGRRAGWPSSTPNPYRRPE